MLIALFDMYLPPQLEYELHEDGDKALPTAAIQSLKQFSIHVCQITVEKSMDPLALYNDSRRQYNSYAHFTGN